MNESLPRLKDIQRRVSEAGGTTFIIGFCGRFRELLDPLSNEYRRTSMSDRNVWVQQFKLYGVTLDELESAFHMDYIEYGRPDIANVAHIGRRAIEMKNVEAAWMESLR